MSSDAKKMKFTFEFSDESNDVIVTEPPCKKTNGRNPKSVARRNARERRRIKNVNSAFDELRLHVPNGEVNRKKISKVSCVC